MSPSKLLSVLRLMFFILWNCVENDILDTYIIIFGINAINKLCFFFAKCVITLMCVYLVIVDAQHGHKTMRKSTSTICSVTKCYNVWVNPEVDRGHHVPSRLATMCENILSYRSMQMHVGRRAMHCSAVKACIDLTSSSCYFFCKTINIIIIPSLLLLLLIQRKMR